MREAAWSFSPTGLNSSAGAARSIVGASALLAKAGTKARLRYAALSIDSAASSARLLDVRGRFQTHLLSLGQPHIA